MISILLTALAALSSQVVYAEQAQNAEQLDKRAGPYDFCNSLGIQIASSVIVAAGPLAGTPYCQSLLNVPKTTVTSTTTSVSTNAPVITVTTTTGSGASTITTTSPLTSTFTSTVPSTTTTVTTFTRDTPMVKKEKRQSNAKGKTPGNNNNANASGSAKNSACSCILGVSPTQTLTVSSTVRSTVTTTVTRTSTSVTPTATITVTSTSTTTTTSTTTSGAARTTQTIHFQRVYNSPTGGQTYTGTSTGTAANEDGCIQLCAQDATCQFVFFQSVSGTTSCIFSTNSYSAANLVNDNTVTYATGYNRDGIVTKKHKKRKAERKMLRPAK